MVRLREIPRTAAFAWSTSVVDPKIVTGTKAGAVDADFSNDTALELWDLDLKPTDSSVELKATATLQVDARFHAIAWSQPTSARPQGLIAGALESGSLDLWDAEKLASNDTSSRIVRETRSSGAIKSLQFNPHRDDMLASGGAGGALFITNLSNPSSPFRLGTAATNEFDALDWNKKLAHILVTGSSGGFATVWDVRNKRESINLNNQGRKPISAIAWDPTASTKLATATSSDQEPVVLMWDLRNTNAPEKTLRHHDQGILSLSWSISDPRLLLSCGKDNRTVCWDAQTGEAFGDFPVVTNWTFQTSWSPRHPGLFATASFDGKIAIQTVQSTNPDTASSAAATAALDDNDFFASAQNRPQGASFTLPIAPTWLQRPVSATFGFGGKLVKVCPTEEGSHKSKISISTFLADTSVGKASEEFEKMLEQGEFKDFCDTKISTAKSQDEKSDWTVIENLISGSRKNLKEYLGYTEDLQENGDVPYSKGKADAEVDDSFFDHADDDAFSSALAASKTSKTNDPFKLYTGKETESDKKISRALILGKFEEALDVCLKEKRMSDAFMIAICGGERCISKAKAAYFKQSSDAPNYLRILASVSNKNLWDMVYNADLKDWKEVMLAICTYADDAEFSDLCETLGDRLEEIPSGDATATRKDASFCYLSGSKLEKVVKLWLQELQESEKSLVDDADGESSLFSIHAKALQGFIEKVTIFRSVTKYTDDEHNKTENWKLAPLYSKYAEYADILASQGQLQTAARYLELLPTQYPAASVARDRVQQALRKVPAVSSQKQVVGAGASRGQRVIPNFQPAATPSIPVPTAATNIFTPSQPVNTIPQPTYGQPVGQGYTPTGYQQPQQGYAPPQQGYQPPGAGFPTPQPFSGYNQYGSAVPPPPRATQSPSVPPVSKVMNLESWNDTPDFGPKAVPRRGTPSVMTAPLPGSQQTSPPGTVPPPPSIGAGAFGAPPLSKTPVPPPPKPGASATASPISNSATAAFISRAANTYSPPPGVQTLQQPTQASVVPRGASPYNPPPPGAHGVTNNRYAPAPGTAPMSGPGYNSGPPKLTPSPYAQRQGGLNSNYAAPSAPMAELPGVTSPAGGPPPAPPPKGIAKTAPPPLAPPPAAGGKDKGINLPSPQPSGSRPGSRASNRAGDALKYPPGDRSHIPSSSMPIFEVLDQEMQRIKARAPASFKAQVLDTEKRVNLLFDHLNSSSLKQEVLEGMHGVADELSKRDHDTAAARVTGLMKTIDEGGPWLIGVKRLVAMSKATPVHA